MSAHHTINQADELPGFEQEIAWFERLGKRLETTAQRGLLILQGERGWCLQQLVQVPRFDQALVFSNVEDIEGAKPFSKADNLLGSETACVVFDEFSGLSVDTLCMVAGLVKAGGMMVLLMPPAPLADDRYGQWQGRPGSGNHFHHYLQSFYRVSAIALLWCQGEKPPRIPPWQSTQTTALQDGMSAQQRQLFTDMEGWGNESAKLFIITADRGRGKSTLLGLFATKLAEREAVIVTAASRAQAAILLDVLPPESMVTFVAPDELIRAAKRIAWLIIDEAAMLPNSLLQRCVDLADKVLLATTTGGYEGTGQGFLLKFMQRFEAREYRLGQLTDPVRWGKGDLLEQLFNGMLMLKSENPAVKFRQADIRVQGVSKKQLNDDRPLLQQVYNLLVSAHYRTRPSDLRQLMEDESQHLLVASDGEHIAGVLLLVEEGGFSAPLCEQVFMGRRRPQGHLLAQMLTAQAGLRSFAEYRGYRIQRITVHPDCRRQGIGRLLIGAAEQFCNDHAADYLGSSFALDSALAPFWASTGFSLQHIGKGKGSSTGRQTVAVLSSSNKAVVKQVDALREDLDKDLPLCLLTYCNGFACQDVDALLCLHNSAYRLTRLEQDEIDAFAHGFRGFDLSRAVLSRLLMVTLPRVPGLDETSRRLLIEKILLDRDWQYLADSLGVAGRKQLTEQLRLGIKVCYECYQSFSRS